MRQDTLRSLLERFGERYPQRLGIDLRKESREIFKWFLAAILYGAPISEKAATKTYRCLEKYGITTPEAIIRAGWDRLVEVLDEGSYTRYDFKTSTKLLEMAESLIEEYGGDLNVLHSEAKDQNDIEDRLKSLAKGIGPTTARIFLRELRGLWMKADPQPTSLVVTAARKMGVISAKEPGESLKELRKFWKNNEIDGYNFVNFETALMKIGKDFCRKGRCKQCLMAHECLGFT